ncbi:MAG: IS66 family transposase [Gammaproteobacteria bacterium]
MSREEVLALVVERQRQLAAWRAAIDQRKRAGKRQAAPFANGTRAAEPKSPGRQPGSGTFRSRAAPPPEALTEPPVEVQVTLDACPVGRAYARWRAAVPEAPVVHTDDTGWRVGGEPADLMGCETDAATVSQMRPRHRHAAVQAVIPASSAGGMVTDRGRRDEAQAFDRVDQPTCLAHLLRSISAVVATKTGRARDVGEPLKGLLQDALALWHAHRDGPVADFKVEAAALQAATPSQLRDRRRKDPDHQRRLHARGWHHDRGNLLRFLADPRIAPTNHRAERALRPAVMARKVSHGSQNDRGAQAFAVFTSVGRTLANYSGAFVVAGLAHLFRTSSLQSVPP